MPGPDSIKTDTGENDTIPLPTHLLPTRPPLEGCAIDTNSTCIDDTSQSSNTHIHTTHTRHPRIRASETIRQARRELGLHPRAPVLGDHDEAKRQRLLWPRIRLALREPFAEFCGTCVMVLFGNGSVAQVLLSTGAKDAPGGNGFGGYQSVNWG